jgi:hypothetical protein
MSLVTYRNDGGSMIQRNSSDITIHRLFSVCFKTECRSHRILAEVQEEMENPNITSKLNVLG